MKCSNKGAVASRRPARQSSGSGNSSATVAAALAFPAAVAELRRYEQTSVLMFEFHGWVVIEAAESGEGALQRRNATVELFNGIFDEVRDEFSSVFEIRSASNDQLVIIAHGLRNHRCEPVIKLFSQIAESVPEAYGLLGARLGSVLGFYAGTVPATGSQKEKR